MPNQPPRHNPSSRAKPIPRASRHERGYNNAWARASKAFLRDNPLCAECERQGRTTPATVTDHVIPHKGDETLFNDTANWQPLCVKCHNIKSSKE